MTRALLSMMLLAWPTWPPARPVGQSASDRDAEPSLADRLGPVFAEWARPGSPGCAVGVIKDGSWLYKKAFGTADLAHGVPFTTRTVSNIASTSKQFTALAVLVLVESGKATLDDDIRRYVPELPSYDRPITVRHLLHHTSGLRDYLMLMQFTGVELGRGYLSNTEILRLVARQSALNFEPGTAFEYSNTGYYLLALIVERVSGRSMADFAKGEIFEPLGMHDTRFQSDVRDIVPRLARGYGRRPAGGLRIREEQTDDIGAGGVLTTLEDLLAWDRNFYEPQVGNAAVIRTMLTPGHLANGERTDYGGGLMLGSYRGLPTVEHPGHTLGHGAQMLRFPEQATTVIVLCNGHSELMDPGDLAFEVADRVLDGAFKEAAPEARRRDERDAAVEVLSPGQAGRLGGVYIREHDVIEITAKDGRLRMAVNGNRSRALVPNGERRFRVSGMPWLVEFPDSDSSARRSLGFRSSEHSGVLAFTVPEVLSAAAVAAYTGRYRCDDLDATYTVSNEEAGLRVRLTRYPDRDVFPKPLVMLESDVFTDANMTYFTFRRDATGAVTEFRLDDPRAKNLRFRKVEEE